MESNDLNGFRQMAEAIYKAEANFRPALRTASADFRARCLAMLEHGARETAAPFKGRRTGRVAGKRIPVSQIAEAGARAAFRKYLDDMNIRRRDVIGGEKGLGAQESDTAAVAAVPLEGMKGQEYESGASTESRSKGNDRNRRPPGFGEGSSTPDPAKIWNGAALNSRLIPRPPAMLAGSGAWAVWIPGMLYDTRQRIAWAWRRLRGDVTGPISLIDANLEELHSVPGTELRLTRGPFTFRKPNRYAKT